MVVESPGVLDLLLVGERLGHVVVAALGAQDVGGEVSDADLLVTGPVRTADLERTGVVRTLQSSPRII